MPKKEVCLFMDDVRKPPKGWLLARTVRSAMFILESRNVVEASFDHDMGEELDGMDIVRWMIQNKICPDIVTIHSSNVVRAPIMAEDLRRAFPNSSVCWKIFEPVIYP